MSLLPIDPPKEMIIDVCYDFDTVNNVEKVLQSWWSLIVIPVFLETVPPRPVVITQLCFDIPSIIGKYGCPVMQIMPILPLYRGGASVG